MRHGAESEPPAGASKRTSRHRAERVSAGDDVVFDLLFPPGGTGEGTRHPSRLGRSEVLDKLSHELRTPITTIYGGSKVLRRPSGLPDDVRLEVSAAVEAEADRLYHLVEDLLVLARLGGGRTEPLRREPVLLKHVLPTIMRLESARVPARKIVLRTPRLMPAAAGDGEAIGHAVRNLVANALQHGSPAPGDVDSSVEVRAEIGDSELRVVVRDHGPGIDPDEADALFEPFYRSERTADAGGAGLGLAATRRLVDAMGGRTWAIACPDGGAEFGLALPIYDGQAAAPA